MNGREPSKWTLVSVSLAVATLVYLVFGQTLGHQFVNFDDESYVYANPVISRGLSWSSIGWAFTHVLSHNWHPLTALSHMVDCQIFGLKPAGHHFTNVLLHTTATILLMIALFQMTGAFWRSAFVAALFGVHPLHVESVAWIAERKDVLSAVFFMLTLMAYTRYTRKPSPWHYLLLSILFACGLMSKPMLVTVPLILLLLDYWPLQRFETGKTKISRLLLEKTPLLVMATAVAIITVVVQRRGINSSVENISLPWRIGNALISATIYLRQMIWPDRLAVFYPHLGSQLPIWQIVIALLLLVCIMVAALLLRQARPYFFCGWLWYIGMLMPVIGIIQVGNQGHADRYMYLPQIGLLVAIAWGITDLSREWRARRLVLTSATAILVGLLTWRASIQTSFWRDSESLWTRAITVTNNNDLAHERLAGALLDKNRPDDAILQAQMAIKIKNTNASAENDLGVALSRKGQPDEALVHFRKARELDNTLSDIHYNSANALAAGGNITEAIAEYEKQLEVNPNFTEAHNNLALLLLRTGRLREAEDHLLKALQIKPKYPEAHNNLAIVFSQSGRMEEAIAQWEKTLSIDADNLDAHCNLAWVLATSPADSIRNGPAALEHAQRALTLSARSNPRIWRLVALAQAELGHFDAASEAAERALRLAQDQNNAALVQTLQSNITSFRSGMPVRDTRQTSGR